MEAWELVAAAGAVAAAAAGVGFAISRRGRGGAAAPEVRPKIEAEARPGDRMWRGLAATRQRLAAQIDAVLGRGPRPLDVVLGELDEALVGADVGVRTSAALLQALRDRLPRDAPPEAVRNALESALGDMLAAPPAPAPSTRPWVILVTGVNGVGKTTTIGKLAAMHAAAGRRVLLVAADTFRAAAIDQLGVWADRTGADLVRHDQGADPSAVVFDGLKAAVARRADIVLVDTAGRLHTRSNLMEELGKVGRVIGREIPGAPHETFLVVDATTGQNAVNQARTFGGAVPLTGVILTKLDGTARGGVLVAIRHELGLPIRYVGVGESVEDLRPFEAKAFVSGLFRPSDGSSERS
ncbi:MAG TPA: signal recognition particle-docking protein FtsY [Candidatus Binatia bacterium]|nr:signal recognition particle-docking protein FtsY [Candidatus Binatia bacterium]